MGASQTATRNSITQLEESGRGRDMSYLLKKLSHGEQNYTANGGKLLGFVSFL